MHEINSALTIATIVLNSITYLILFVFISHRIRRSIRALDYLIVFFIFVNLAVTSQLGNLFLHDEIFIFSLYQGTSSPLMFDMVRNFTVLSLITLYVMAEHIIQERLTLVRSGIIIVALVFYLFELVYYLSEGSVLSIQILFPFAQDTRLGEFFFDIIHFTAIGTLIYAFILQKQYSKLQSFQQNLNLILFGLVVYVLGYTYEISEHFFPIIDINATFFTTPTFIIIGYVYIRNPQMVYIAPTNIRFLQVIHKNGHLLFGAEVKDGISDTELFVAPVLSSLNNLFNEMLPEQNDEESIIENIKLSTGSILFEKVDEILLILQSSHPSRIIKRAMRHFVREFTKIYEDQLSSLSFTGKLTTYQGQETPEDLLKRCIPVLMDKILTSTPDDLLNITN